MRQSKRYLLLEVPEGPAAATSIQKNSGLPQGPADPSAGRLKHAANRRLQASLTAILQGGGRRSAPREQVPCLT
jgi:hypothetical protein